MINKTSLLYVQCYFFSYPVFISKLLHALAPMDLLPMKAPVLEKKGRKQRAEVKLFIQLTHTDASSTGLCWGKRSSHVHAVTPNDS